MSSISHQYEMEAGTSRMLETCHESSVLIETVDTIVADNGVQGEKYFVVTEVDGGQTDLVEISGVEKLDGDNSIEENQPWAEICRVCASSSDHLIPIFEGEGLEHEISSKIQRYLPIQVCEDDSLPVHLCYHCAATLLAWHELVDGCLDAEQRLLRMQTELEEKHQADVMGESLDEGNGASTADDTRVSIKDQLSEEELVVKGECNEESATTDSERCLLREEEITESLLKTIEPCVDEEEQLTYEDTTDVTVVYSKEQDGQQHKDSIVLMIPPNKPHNPDARVYGCRTCNTYNLMFDEFSTHLSSHSSDNGEYAEACESQETLHAAVARSLESATVFTCDICGIECDSQETLLQHLDTHTRDETYVCKFCNVIFTSEIELQEHVSLRHVISCRDCDSEFDTQISLENHIKEIHTNKKLITCETCDKMFRNKSSLRHHMVRHTDVQPYVCKTCDGAFKHRSSLYMHERAVHQKIKAFSCVTCHKKFALKTQLRTHMRVHTGERPYACDICSQTFKTPSQLQMHKDVHFDNRPFPCEYCEKKFRRRPNLILHLRTHTGEKPHLCDLCGRGFAQRGDVKKHKATHYKLKKPSTPHGYCQSSVS